MRMLFRSRNSQFLRENAREQCQIESGRLSNIQLYLDGPESNEPKSWDMTQLASSTAVIHPAWDERSSPRIVAHQNTAGEMKKKD